LSAPGGALEGGIVCTKSARLAIIAVLLLVLGGCGAGFVSYAADWSTVQVSLTTTSAKVYRTEKEYKNDCRHIDYRDFKRDPSAHKGEDIYLVGTVTRIDQSTNMVPDKGFTMLMLGIGPTNAGNGAYDQTVFALWPGPLPDVHSGTVLAVWGQSAGAYSAADSGGTWDEPSRPTVYGEYLAREN
jgi:hypothetical protein